MNFRELFNGNTNVPNVVMEFYQRVLDGLACLNRDSADTAEATTGTARTLAYQFGTPPQVGSAPVLTPRSMLNLPKVYEGTTASAQELKVMQDTGRCASAGWVSNLGDEPFMVQLVAWDGGATDPFTMPAGASFQVMCLVKSVTVIPADEETPAHFQAVLS